MNEWNIIKVISDDQYIQRYSSNEESVNLFNVVFNTTKSDLATLHLKHYIFIYKLDRFNQFRYLNSNSNSNEVNNKYLCYQRGKQELLSSFKIVVTDNELNNNNLSIAIISNSYSKRFKLQQDDIIHVKLTKITSVSLERIVLLSNDLQSFESVIVRSQNSNASSNNKNNYQADPSFKQYLMENSILFNQDSTLHIAHKNQPLSFEIMECYPLLQGSITSSSTIIIVGPDQMDTLEKKLNKLNLHSPIANINSSNINSNNSSSYVSSNNLRISNFIIHPLSQPTTISLNQQQESAIANQSAVNNNSTSLFHFTPNSNRILLNNTVQIKQLQTIPNDIYLPLIDPQYDYLYDAIVTLNTLKQYGLFHGATIKLKSLLNHKLIVIRIFSIMDINNSNNSSINQNDSIISQLNIEDGYLYLSPLSLFNLGFEPKSLLSKSTNFNVEISLLKGVAFPTATQVKISRVKSNTSDGHTSYSQELIEFFDKIRVFKEGDLFVLYPNINNIDNSNSNNNSQSTIDSISSPIFFRIESIQCQGSLITSSPGGCEDGADQLFVVDKEKSTMIQEGASQSLIPYQIQSFYSRGTLCQDFIVYENEFKKMTELALPFFHSFDFDFNCTLLVKGSTGAGKRTLIRQLSNHLGIHLFEIDCFQLYSFNELEKEANIKRVLEKAAESTPSMLLLSNFEVLEQSPTTIQHEKKESNVSNILKETLNMIMDKLFMMESLYQQQNKLNKINYPFIIAATVQSTDDMSGKLRSWFKYEIELNAPDENQRFKLLKNIFKNIPINNSVSMKNIAMRTASFLPQNLKNLAERAGMKALKRVTSTVSLSNLDPEEVCNCGMNVTNDDVSEALTEMQGYQSSSLGAPKIPNVKWDDVGGLANVKSEIMDTIQLPLENPHLFASGIGKRSGILFYGPPGTGKTLLAKAIATECSLNFLSVKGPELINMYIGESEKNIRDIFNKARQAKPCVIFFDELDSLAPARGNGADSGGVMDRVVSQLLAELDGMQKSSDVFIIGATNRPDLLDPALMIPGRLDRLLYLGISSDKDSQLKIVQALTRKFHLHPDVDLRAVVERCSMNLTGSDFYALCSDALANAIKDMITQLEEQRKLKRQNNPNVKAEDDDDDQDEDQQVIVGQKHFLDAVDALIPSVSQDEMAYYNKVQKQFTKQK